jgi:hypothetical protein
MLVLADIAAGDKPSRLKDKTPEPTRRAITFPVGDRRYEGDLYESPEGVSAAILLVPGAAKKGKDDRRLVVLATALARARFAVMVPDLPGLRRLEVTPGNVQEVRAAFAWLCAQPELAPKGRAGLAGISYASGPAVLAALEPEIRERVRFILCIGGYYNLEKVLTFLTTGYFEKDGEWHHLAPSTYGKWVFVLSTVDRISDPRDRLTLKEIARGKLNDLDAGGNELAGRLGREGQAMIAFVTNRDPQRFSELLKGLPKNVQLDIDALNPARRDLSGLKARVILVHGLDDNIIPYTESIAFAGALPAHQTKLFLVGGLFHVDLKPGVSDKIGLVRVIYHLLGQRRDGGTRGAD